MPASRYDIYAEQGSTFKLHLDYKYKGGTGIDLTNFTGELQVRRSEKDNQVVLFLTDVGVTGGGTTGEFTIGVDGVAGIGGISFNTSTSGTSGYTGGIMFKVDKTTMKSVPAGKHFYDFEITNSLGETYRLVEGSFEVSREITK
jgi:hypothetical protein